MEQRSGSQAVLFREVVDGFISALKGRYGRQRRERLLIHDRICETGLQPVPLLGSLGMSPHSRPCACCCWHLQAHFYRGPDPLQEGFDGQS